MGITGLLPFIEKASRRANIIEFSGCTVAIDTYCWLHKGAFACADKLVRGEETDIHIKYCMKFVNMLLSKNIKPILVFDGQHLPAKAMTETKRRESRTIAKKRAAELLKLGKTDEARSYMRRCVDITHDMALCLIRECRSIGVDSIVAPYEADSQLAYLNINNVAQLILTEDSDLILFGCKKILFKMSLDGTGTLVETEKLPLVMKCPIEKYTFDKFRYMCIMSGCDYVSSLPGIGLSKARQFVNATQDTCFANALRKLPRFFNKGSMIVSAEYLDSFLKAEATFKHQYVYDPIDRVMKRLTDCEDDDELELCCNAGKPLEPDIALQLAVGNLDPFTLRVMDTWHPDCIEDKNIKAKSDGWTEKPKYPSIWHKSYKKYLEHTHPWKKCSLNTGNNTNNIMEVHGVRRKIRDSCKVAVISRSIPETQDDSLSIDELTSMYLPTTNKKARLSDESSETASRPTDKQCSPILINKNRSFKGSYTLLKQMSKFPRTVLTEEVIESKYFNSTDEPISDSQKENSFNSEEDGCDETVATKYSRNPFKLRSDVNCLSEDVIENTYPMEELVTPVDSQTSFGETPSSSQVTNSQYEELCNTESGSTLKSYNVLPQVYNKSNLIKPKSKCKVSGLQKKNAPSIIVPANQPTLLSKFGFKKRPAMKT